MSIGVKIVPPVVKGEGWVENEGNHTQEVPEYRDDHDLDTEERG